MNTITSYQHRRKSLTSLSYPYDHDHSSYYKLFLPNDPRPHGYMLPEVAKKMPWTSDFTLHHSHPLSITVKDTSNGTDTANTINAAFSRLVSIAIDQDLFAIIHKQHSEPFAIPGANYSIPISIERFASPLFGIINRGAHLTIYTYVSPSPSSSSSPPTVSEKPPSSSAKELKIWVPRRSETMFTYPNMLDSTVAGGVRATETPYECILHEADEEASLPASIVHSSLKSVGCVTYMSLSSTGSGGEHGLVVPDVLYTYDMELGEDQKPPEPRDEEVKEFYLLGVEEVKRALGRGEFKPNSAVVMVDFLIRHGVVAYEEERDLVEIVARMHRRLPFPTASDVGSRVQA